MMENNGSENQALETTTSATDTTETTMSQEAAPAAPAGRSVPVITIDRRIYTFHKVYGHCVTYDARVYLAPATANFEKKVVYRGNFRVGDGFLLDVDGGVWIDGGENGGCGPRCPLSLKETHGKIWHSIPRADREAILKALVAAKSA